MQCWSVLRTKFLVNNVNNVPAIDRDCRYCFLGSNHFHLTPPTDIGKVAYIEGKDVIHSNSHVRDNHAQDVIHKTEGSTTLRSV